jgi:hypothetical protein
MRSLPLSAWQMLVLAWPIGHNGLGQEILMDSQDKTQKGFVGAGGTPGGVGTFLLGFAFACAGGWLLTNQVTVSSEYFASGFMVPFLNWHMNSFGLSLIPFILGIGFLFFNGKSLAGWLLTVAGLVIILAGILMSLHIYFRPTSLFNTLTMLVLLFGGLGLIVRSLKATPAASTEGSADAGGKTQT